MPYATPSLPFTSAADFETYLDGLGLFHMELGLERIRSCLDRLGLARLPFSVAQVVGTNGKGATSAYLATLAGAHGLRAGLFTSPHFIHPRERIRILEAGQDRMVSEKAWLEAANTCLQVSGLSGPRRLTYFELLTAMAARIFAQASVDLAVFEAGLGGSYDSTSALPHNLLVLARIGLDHENILGHTLKAIATDKSGAMRPGDRIISTPQREAVRCVLREQAEKNNATLEFVSQRNNPGDTFLDSSFALARAAWQHLAETFSCPWDDASALLARQATRLSGRLQFVDAAHGRHPRLLLDGAHNADGLEALRAYVHTHLEPPKTIIFTSMQDRPIERLAPIVTSIAECPILVPQLAHNPRAWNAVDLALHLGPEARPCEDLADALHTALYCCGPQGLTLLCGSLYLLADFFNLRPELLDLSP